MHSRLIFLHRVSFPKGGRLFKFPVSYGYDIGNLGKAGRQIRQRTFLGYRDPVSSRGEEIRMSQEKPLGLSEARPYRKPTQVDGCNCTKANERNIVRELGKKAAVTSG